MLMTDNKKTLENVEGFNQERKGSEGANE